MFVAALATAILLGYVASLWWLLRREPAAAIVALVVLCGVCATLRVVHSTDYPAGLNGDEVKNLWCSANALRAGSLFRSSCTGPPFLLSVLFQAPLVSVLGPSQWVVRIYPLVTSVLAVPAAFAVARAMGLRIFSSLAVSAFIAVLPWSIFYGRISLGGELVFHQLLLLAGLARLVWAGGRWPEVAIGTFGLSLLLYDYSAGRAMLGMPLVAAGLAHGQRRALCLVVLVLAVLSWTPYLVTSRGGPAVALRTHLLHPGYATQPLKTLEVRTRYVLGAFVKPVGKDGQFSIRSAALHPLLILVLAPLAAFAGARRSLFLLAGVLGGLMPSVLSWGGAASAHRMIMSFPFIALGAGCGLDSVPWRRWRTMATLSAVVIVGVQSVRLYFSPAFWPAESRRRFDWQRTALVDALPPSPHPRLIAMELVEDYLGPRSLVEPSPELLSAENWFPPDEHPSIYAFSPEGAPLKALYEQLPGAKVQPFGNAFLVTLEARDRSWFRQYGWTYEVQCGDAVTQHQVPILFLVRRLAHAPPWTLWSDWSKRLKRKNARCRKPMTHVWRGHWNGPETRMRLHFTGDALVEAGDFRREKSGFEERIDFVLKPGMDVTVTLASSPEVLEQHHRQLLDERARLSAAVPITHLSLDPRWRLRRKPPSGWESAALMKLTPDGEGLPDWSEVNPP